MMNYYKDIYQYLTNKYPNRKVFIISDHHFYHENIIKYERPQFDNINDMNNFIINNHNDTVSKDDIVIFLGDFSFKKQEISNLLSKMNGHKFLLMGNHDKPSIVNSYTNLGFEGLFTLPAQFQNSVLSHYPLDDTKNNSLHYQLLSKEFNQQNNAINYHGHIHTTEQSKSNSINVTCEATDYKPMFIGFTGEKRKTDITNFITSKEFAKTISQIEKEKNLSQNLLISDYIYSMVLESINDLFQSTLIYGSYPQYKKYGYISNFSDIDIAVLFNDDLSKKKNSQVLRDAINKSYSILNEIDENTLEFIKKYVNMCAYKFSYANGFSLPVNGAVDANLVPINYYKDTDFIIYEDSSTIEKFLAKNNSSILDECTFPRFNATFLTAEADISNLILQILFQKDNTAKKDIAIKKLLYISKYFIKDIDSNNLEDILIRYMLRNITFLYTLRRISEIEYIKSIHIPNDMSFPNKIKDTLDSILLNPNSYFNDVFNDIKQTKSDDILNKCMMLAKK